MASLKINKVSFSHYKAFNNFSVNLNEFNVLVGPNNSGKSTIIGAFRVLHEGIRKARAKSPERVEVDGLLSLGYKLNLDELPIASENIFHEYDDSRAATIIFKLSNENSLRLHFPERGFCIMLAEPKIGQINTPKQFKIAFDIEISFVPILGPVEQKEKLYEKEAARLALLSSRASRNFRNIWYHYPEDFDAFKELIQSTWPGMNILPPELNEIGGPLHMFCPEERHLREICWSGYGFQVWAQMLTFIVKAKNASILVIDEPDIYLHSDLQRQLVALLKDLGPDIVIATHSTEIIAECEPTSLLTINKKKNVASRVKDVSQLKRVFAALGSNLNPTLTQLAKTKRAVFVEGHDFQILAPLARSLGMQRLANRADFAVIQTEGFNPRRAIDLASGIEKTIGGKILRAVILDRDYRSDEEIIDITKELTKNGFQVHIHQRKEIENYLLEVTPLTITIHKRLKEKAKRSNQKLQDMPNVEKILQQCLEESRHDVFAQKLAKYSEFKKRTGSSLDQATINSNYLKEFEKEWGERDGSKNMAPGKEILAKFNSILQKQDSITVTDGQIASSFTHETLPEDLKILLDLLQDFSAKTSLE